MPDPARPALNGLSDLAGRDPWDRAKIASWNIAIDLLADIARRPNGGGDDGFDHDPWRRQAEQSEGPHKQ